MAAAMCRWGWLMGTLHMSRRWRAGVLARSSQCRPSMQRQAETRTPCPNTWLQQGCGAGLREWQLPVTSVAAHALYAVQVCRA